MNSTFIFPIFVLLPKIDLHTPCDHHIHKTCNDIVKINKTHYVLTENIA